MNTASRFFTFMFSGIMGIASANAASSTMDIFGIRLGTSFTLSQCSYRRLDSSTIFYNPPSQGSCYEIIGGEGRTTIEANDTVQVDWSADDAPQLVSGGSAIIQLVNGKVEGVGFNTMGVEFQKRDLQMLVAKFGQPTTIKTPTVSNLLGAVTQVIFATWNVDGIQIYFNSAEDGLDKGLVNIDTPTGTAYKKAALEKLDRQRTKL